MKVRIILNLNELSRIGKRESSITLRFEYCGHEKFHEWLEDNSIRLKSICERWGWDYDIGYSDMVVYITKIDYSYE